MIPLNKSQRLIYDEQVNHQGLLQFNKNYWNQNEIISILLKDRKNPDKVDAWIIYGKASIHGALQSAILTGKLPINITNAAIDPRGTGIQPYTDETIKKQMLTADYVLTYQERFYDASRWPVFLEKTRQIFQENINNFTVVKKLEMPDGNIMYMYMNKLKFNISHHDT